METPNPIHPLQELFVRIAEIKLPPDPRITTNKYHVMTYFWPSPCERLQGLWIYVDDYEIRLTTALSHCHVDKHSWEVRNAESGSVLERIVDQGVAQALDIFSGETVFVKTYDPEGNEQTSSGMSPRRLWNDLEDRTNWTEFNGDGWTARAWDWRGEVTD
jgi:hypothetical protein